ncbi:hypothetical protein OT109_09760 [Phycisphaeraceae bacterium D3-23]
MPAGCHNPLFPPAPDGAERLPRCLGCGYRLDGLSHPACPECGRRYDAARPETYSLRRPFVWHRYWWPGMLFTLVSGLVWAVFFYGIGELGWGLFIGLPFMLGTLMGYGGRFNGWMGLLLGPVCLMLCVAMLVALLMVGGLAGMFCGAFLLLFLIPIGIGGLFFGIFAARALAAILKQTAFSQREYLPLLLVIFLLPGLAHLAQVLFAPPVQVETIQTTQRVAARPMSAWDAWMFYEEVDHQPPWLLRMGLPTPSHVEGRIVTVGDREVCVYTGDARLVKRGTSVEPGRLLAFDVVGQHSFEDNSIRLIDGSFRFTPAGPEATDVTLSTRYEPLLRPRALWRPIEHAVTRQLHGHVLEGMRLEIERRRYADNTGGPR